MRLARRISFALLFLAACSHERSSRDAASGEDGAVAEGPRLDLTTGDLADVADLGGTLDLAVPTDLAGASTDLAASPDQAIAHDFAVPTDLARPLDLTMPADLSSPPDMAESNDPFDPASCTGTPLTNAAAISRLGAASRTALANGTWMVRERTCTSPSACGPWGPTKPYVVTLVTYSGGVTTHYKNFSFPTTLVLRQSSGVATLDVREAHSYTTYPTATDKGIPYALPANPGDKHLPTIEIHDPSPSGNDYPDLQYALYYPADEAYLWATDHCARFSAPYDDGTREVGALYRY